MKVVFLYLEIDRGGIGRLISTILRHLNRSFFNPILCLLRDNVNYEIPPDIRYICLNSIGGFASAFQVIWQLKKVYEHEKPEVVVSFMDFIDIFALTARLLSRHKPKILVVVCNQVSRRLAYERQYGSYLANLVVPWVIGKILPKYYKAADMIICVSESVRDDMINNFNLSKNNLKVIYSPIDSNFISKQATNLIHHTWFEKKNTPLIITTARLVHSKGYASLLHSFAKVTEEVDAKLVILGDGPQEKEFRGIADYYLLDGKVDFLGFQKNPYSYLYQSDIFVLPSQCEGFSISILEAMCCNCAIITTEHASAIELIQHGINGMLVPIDNTDALAAAILSLLQDKQLRLKIASRGVTTSGEYDSVKIVPQYERILSEIHTNH